MGAKDEINTQDHFTSKMSLIMIDTQRGVARERES